MRAVLADRDLTRSARSTGLKELVEAAVEFIILNQDMSVKQEGNPHRLATREEVLERVASCIDGVSIEKFVAEMGDRGVDEEQAWDAAYYPHYGDVELWGMTYAEAIQSAASLGIKYNPIVNLES
jgi:hypothetical protein